MIRKQVLTRRQKWFPHRRPDPGVVAVLQLAGELRVVPVDVQQHEVAVVPFRALWHALRGRGAIGALQIQLFREGRGVPWSSSSFGGMAAVWRVPLGGKHDYSRTNRCLRGVRE